MAQGPSARPALARATMVCLVNSHAKGIAGVRPALADMVLTALNEVFVPVMRILGSVGQADLGPMADLAEGLLQHSGFSQEDNEGLALVNSNAFGTASAAFAVIEAERLLDMVAVAAALDFVRIALAPVVTSAMERTLKLLQSPLSGLPAGLAAATTTEDALAELAVASQALTVEARTLAAPVSYELASTTKGEGIEDRTSMAPLSARRLTEMVELGARVVAIELVVAAQAVDLRPRDQQGRGARDAYELVRGLVPFTAPGEAPPEDLEPVVDAVRRGELAAVLGTGTTSTGT